jgi:predicted GH43/DUF377 family glycosyl hydrolase
VDRATQLRARRVSDRPVIDAGAVRGYASIFNAGVVHVDERYHLFARGVREGYRRNEDEGPRFLDYVSDVLVFTSADGQAFEFQQILALSSPDGVHCFEDPRVQFVESGGIRHAVMTYTNLPAPESGLPWRIGAHRLEFDGDRFTLDHGSSRLLGPDGHQNKDAVLFNLDDGRVGLIHRLHPNMQLAVFESIDHAWHAGPEYWDDHLRRLDDHTLIAPTEGSLGVGAGAPPVATDEGLLLFFHERMADGVYTMKVALLDSTTGRVVSTLSDPILHPELDWECRGDVDNVVFVGGAHRHDDGRIYLTYGAADRCVGAATIDERELLDALAA